MKCENFEINDTTNNNFFLTEASRNLRKNLSQPHKQPQATTKKPQKSHNRTNRRKNRRTCSDALSASSRDALNVLQTLPPRTASPPAIISYRFLYYYRRFSPRLFLDGSVKRLSSRNIPILQTTCDKLVRLGKVVSHRTP